VGFIADEFVSTGLSHDDYAGMHVQNRGTAERRLAAPTWAFNDSQLRELLVHFIERRAGFRNPRSGTHAERLARAKARLASRVPRMTTTLTDLCREYVAVKKRDRDARRRRLLEIEIENLDTQLRFIKKPEAIVAGVVFHYYRRGADSVETGLCLGMKPPHVRMILWRLNRLWDQMLDSPRGRA
jgi:hypothetical protein